MYNSQLSNHPGSLPGLWDTRPFLFAVISQKLTKVQPRPQTTSVHLGPLGLLDSPSCPSQTTQSILGPPTSVPPRATRIIRTIWSLRLSMTLYGLPHLDSIVLLPCHSLNLTCTRLALRDPVSTPLGSSGTAPHSFLWILYLAVAWTSTSPEHAAFGLWTLPFYCTI